MIPKNIPRTLDSKTSCLRITVPENLDLALEGLIRKVLREQPKTDDIYSFAAEYFETLLKIRDKAGAKFTAAQLCPFHNDEDAHEMIILADSFSKRFPKRLKDEVRLKATGVGSKKKNEDLGLEKNLGSKEKLKEANPQDGKKQSTPDLIKKLPLLSLSQEEGEKDAQREIAGPEGPERNESETVRAGSDEEEFLTSDPIKELVEKELLVESSEKEPQEKCAEPVKDKPTIGGDDVAESKEANEVEKSGAVYVKQASREEPRDPEAGAADVEQDDTREGIDKRGKEGYNKEAEVELPLKPPGLTPGDARRRESEGGQDLPEMQPKEEKEDKEEFRTEEKLGIKTEAVEAPLLTERELPVHEVRDSHNTAAAGASNLEDRGAIQKLAEVTLPEQKEVAVFEGDVTETPTSVGPSIKHAENSEVSSGNETTEALPLVTKLDEAEQLSKYETFPTENHESQNGKADQEKTADQVAESSEQGKPKEDLATEKGTEQQKNNSENINLPEERAKLVQELREALNQRRDGISKSKEGEPPETKQVEEKGEATGSEENEVKTKPEDTEVAKDSSDESRLGKAEETSEKLISDEEDRGVESAKSQETTESNKPDQNDDYGKTDEEKLRAENENQTDNELRNKKSQSDHSQSDEISTAPEGGSENATNIPEEKGISNTDSHLSNQTSEIKSEAQENVKQDVPGEGSTPTADTERLPADRTEGEMAEVATTETESSQPREYEIEDGPVSQKEEASLPGEELCSVVDILQVPRESAQDGERQVAPKPDQPEIEKPSTESGKPQEETTSGENSNDNEAKDGQTEESPVAIEAQLPAVKSESDRNEVDFEGPTQENHRLVQSPESAGRENQSQLESDGPADGKHVIIIEEPERTADAAEESLPPREVQIKTIQTHYYDALRVPEIVTKEYRIHEVTAPPIVASIVGTTAPSFQSNEVRESPEVEKWPQEMAEENAPSPHEKKTSAEATEDHPPEDPSESPGGPPKAETDGNASAEATEDHPPADIAEPPGFPPKVETNGLPILETLAQVDQVHPTTAEISNPTNLSEISLQSASEIFLNSERSFSSLEQEEIRYVTSRTDEPAESDVLKSRPEVEEVFQKTVVPPLEETSSPSPSEAEGGAEAKKKEDEEPPAGKTADGNSPIVSPLAANSVSADRSDEAQKEKSETETQDEMESGVGETERKSYDEKTPEPKAADVGSEQPRAEGRGEPRPSERSVTGEGSWAESDSTATSAATEVKRSDSAKRNFASAPSLSSARSFDSGKRNPLVRTRSLSTNRHGVADFEVWSTIERELEEAATKIQSKYRGYKTRKKLRRENAVQITTEESSRRTTPGEVDGEDEGRRSTGEFHDSIVLSDHPR